MKKKLAIFTGSDIRTFGGGERYVVELVKRLKNHFDITVYSFTDKNNLRVNDRKIRRMLNGVALKYYRAIIMPKSLDRIPLTLSSLYSYLELRKFNAVYHMESSLTAIAAVLLALKFSKTRLIFGLHNPYLIERLTFLKNKNQTSLKLLYYWVYKRLLFSVPNIHVLNGYHYKILKQLGYSGNLYFIQNFLYYNKSSIKPMNTSRFTVLFVGRLSIYHKGLDLLETIINETLKLNKGIEFHIVGSGEDGKNIIEKLTLAYPKNVIYGGFLSQDRLEKEYDGASIFILTSRIEAFSLVTLEAQAHGLPVISFDIPGPNEIIKKIFSGTLIKPFNTTEFSKAVLYYYQLWKVGKLNKAYKQKIIDYIFDKYSNKKIIPKIREMLE